jgi:hypothetical protein
MSASYWEERFQGWAAGPGSSEEDRIENAVTAIRKAMEADDKLASITKVYVQGSYRNRVNVRQESDVDIAVLYTGGGSYGEYPEGFTRERFGLSRHHYNYRQFKDDVANALVNRFGANGVYRSSKAFDIHPNSYRVDADVVPVFEHRRYNADGSYYSGVQFFSDAGETIINWPEQLLSGWPRQHYEEAITKNEATKRTFKRVVRILKKLRVIMAEAGHQSAKDIPGFQIECMVFNVPNDRFLYPTWDEVVTRVLRNIWTNTQTSEKCKDWREVSRWKWLFRGFPDAKRAAAHKFINEAWNFIGVRKYD